MVKAKAKAKVEGLKSSEFDFEFDVVCQTFQRYLSRKFESSFYYVVWEVRLYWLAYFIEVVRRVLFNVFPFFELHEEKVFNKSEKLNRLRRIFQSVSGQVLPLHVDVRGLQFRMSNFSVRLCRELFEEVEERFKFFTEIVYEMKNLIVNQIYQRKRYDKSEIESAFYRSIYAVFWRLKPTSRMYVYFQKWVEVGSKREEEKVKKYLFFDDLFENDEGKGEDFAMKCLYGKTTDVDNFMIDSPEVFLIKKEEEEELMKKEARRQKKKTDEDMEVVFFGAVLDHLLK